MNTIACYKLLTGKDGQKGAAKDMIDCDRYGVMSDIWDCGVEMACEVGAPAAAKSVVRAAGDAELFAGRRSKIVNW